MSVNNPLSGHTDGTNDGLKDGDHILSPSLTNLYEGVHGNGILLPHDTAYGDSDRNDPPDLPGAISAGSAANQFVVKACDVILDGVLYAIGGGSDITVTLTTSTSQKLGTFTALSTNQECIFVVIATAEGLKVSQTTPITTATGAYPSITGTAAAYLKTGGGAGENRQSVVLGTVRATRVTGSTVGDLNIQSLSEYNDKRVFVRPTPLFLSPVRDGNKTSTTGISDHTALSQVHGTGQHGNYGDNGVVWQSFNANNESMLYYSRKDSSNRHTHLLGPTNVNVLSTSSNQTFTFDSDQVFVITAGSTINLNPSGTFPPGHQVFVSVPSGSTVTFDSSGANVSIAAGSAVMFVYDGASWKTVLYSSTIATTSSGTSGLVQLSDGSGGFTSDTALSFNTSTNVLTVDGKLTVTGLIDPTGLVVDEKADTAATGHSSAAGKGLYWVKSDTPNRPMFTNDAGTEKKVLITGDNVSELTNDAGYVDASGAASAAPATNLGYTASSRTVTSSTGTDAVITEVVAGGNSGLMTGADKTKLDGIATSATSYSDADAIAAVEGEATLTLASGLTVGTDLKISSSSNHVTIQNETQDKDIIFKVNDGGVETEVIRISGDDGYVGIGGITAPSAQLHLRSSVSAQPELRLENTNADSQEATIRFMKNTTSPAASDDLGIIRFEGEDSGGANTLYAYVMAQMVDPTDTQEAGEFFFHVKHKGVTNAINALTISGHPTADGEVCVNDGGRDDINFRVEGDTEQYLLFTDAANDRVSIGHNGPTAMLDIETGGTFRNTRLLTVSVSASTTLTEAAHAGRYNICAGNITLPSTSTAGEHYAILNTTGGDITIGRNGNNINGAGSDFTLGTFKAATCIAIGSNNWMVVG